MASLPLGWRHSYEASVSLGVQGRRNRVWGLTGIRDNPGSYYLRAREGTLACWGAGFWPRSSFLA
jgi:hypothetical protein